MFRNTQIRIGPYRFHVSADEFRQWELELRRDAGLIPAELLETIKRRLGFCNG